MLSTMPIQVATGAAILLLGAGILSLIRAKLVPKAPIIAAFVALLTAIAFVVVLAWLIGLDINRVPTFLLIAAFMGILWVQPDPWSLQGICRSLATVSGLVAILASFQSDLVALVLALGMTGLLLRLSQSETAKPIIDDSAV